MFKVVAIRFLLKKLLVAGAVVALSYLLLIGFDLSTYRQLTELQEILKVSVHKLTDGKFQVTLDMDGQMTTYELGGDEWQIDMRLIRLQPYVAMLGSSHIYQLERLSSRYRSIEAERKNQRFLYSLVDSKALDVWKMAKNFSPLTPMIASVYGSSVYMPLTDGAVYSMKIGFSGVVVENINDASKQAVSNWQ